MGNRSGAWLTGDLICELGNPALTNPRVPETQNAAHLQFPAAKVDLRKPREMGSRMLVTAGTERRWCDEVCSNDLLRGNTRDRSVGDQ